MDTQLSKGNRGDKVSVEPKKRYELESIYKADEVKRQGVAKALLVNPVATPAMMTQMRTCETTGSRCLRNNAIPIPPGGNFIQRVKELEGISVHDADRLRRLFDHGCPMPIVFWLSEFTNCHADRNHFIAEEEAKLFLEPLVSRSNELK
jgi:hypothetical protein